MNIVFITPAPWLRRLPVYRMNGKLYGQSNSITGPLILGGILKKAGHHVSVYEELNGKVDYKKIIPETDVFCISIMTSNAERGYEIADRVHRESNARVLIGGMHATCMPEEALRHADQVMVGEGEKTIVDVVEGRLTDPIVRGIPIENLDEVPFPDYSILKTPCVAANVMSTRGCPYKCSFCTTSRMFAPYRSRSIDNVMEEIRMYKRMGFKYMNFEDDNFTADKERAKEICRRIIKENLQFKETFFFGRTDMAKDEEMLQLLHDAHLTRVLIGIESLNQDALNTIDKRQSIEDIRRAGEACKRHHIRLIASIVLGIDDDGIEDIHRSIEFAKEIDAYQLQPAILTPFPGTPVYEQFEKENRMLKNISWTSYDMMNVVFIPKKMTPWELQEQFYYAARHFYDFKSAFRIGRIFGAGYGARRFFLAFASHLGPMAAEILSKTLKITPYYKLRHFNPEDQPVTYISKQKDKKTSANIESHTEIKLKREA